MGLFDFFKKNSKNTETKIDLSKKINLRKEKIGISLAKKNVESIVAEVKVVIDKSGSMYELYKDGTVKETIERLAPLAFKFDDDGAMETMLFNTRIKELPDVTEDNLYSYFDDYIGEDEADGGTRYDRPIYKILEYAKRREKQVPIFVIFITDGEDGDENSTKEALIESSNYDIYYQFVGIGNEKFRFLEELDNLKGRKFDNAGFIKIQDLNKISDERLYEQLLDEFVDINKNGTLKSSKIVLSK